VHKNSVICGLPVRGRQTGGLFFASYLRNMPVIT
jgi:hypothetical protein